VCPAALKQGLAPEINSRSIIPNGRVLRVDPVSVQPYKGQTPWRAAHPSANPRAIKPRESSTLRSPGAGVGGHLVDLDREAIGINRDPADLDDRGPRRDLEAVRLGWQWHPGAECGTT
jgi:hypothetical protein